MAVWRVLRTVGVTAVNVLLAGTAILVVGGFVVLTLVAYLGRALTRDRAAKDAPEVVIPPARVVNR